MAYPIQERPLFDHVKTEYVIHGGSTTDLTPYVVEVNLERGGKPDNWSASTQAGNIQVTLHNYPGADSGTIPFITGEFIRVRARDYNITSTLSYVMDGHITEVTVNKNFNSTTGLYDTVTSITATDTIGLAQNITCPAGSLITGATNGQTVSQLLTELNTVSGGIITGTAYYNPSINHHTNEMTAFEVLDMVRESVGTVVYSGKTGTTNVTRCYTGQSYVGLFTDGTHTSTPSGATRIDYTGVDFGTRSEDILSSVTLNVNKMLNKPTKAQDSTQYDTVQLSYTYTNIDKANKSLSFNIDPELTIISQNYVTNSGDGPIPPTWGIDDYAPNQPYLTFGSRIWDNQYATLVTALYEIPLGNYQIELAGPNYGSDMVINRTSTDTTSTWFGKIEFAFTGAPAYDVLGRAKIHWYDINGIELSVTNGSWLTIGTLWTQIYVYGSAPTDAVTCGLSVELDRDWYDSDVELYARKASLCPGNYGGFNGSTPPTTTQMYAWTGTPWSSTSLIFDNQLQTRAVTAVDLQRTGRRLPYRVSFNAQSNLTFAHTLELADKVSVAVDGYQRDMFVAGIQHSITPTSWTIDVDLHANYFI